MDNAVLIVAQENDPHIRCVASQLVSRGVRFISIDIYPNESSERLFSMEYPVEKCTINNVSTANVKSVWWRPKPQFENITDGVADREFAKREWQHALESCEEIFRHAKWINPRQSDRRARYKPTQLKIAARAGFRIPKTIISNNPDDILGFIKRQNGQVIYKPLSWHFAPPDGLLFTNLIGPEFIVSHKDSVRVTPGIFQEKIDKSYEVRLTIVGDRLFPIKIDSQANHVTSLDWRIDPDSLIHEFIEIPESVKLGVLKVHSQLGLVYGAYDFIVTPNQEYVFLEVNPSGQWLWMEEKIGVPISTAIVDVLLEG